MKAVALNTATVERVIAVVSLERDGCRAGSGQRNRRGGDCLRGLLSRAPLGLPEVQGLEVSWGCRAVSVSAHCLVHTVKWWVYLGLLIYASLILGEVCAVEIPQMTVPP